LIQQLDPQLFQLLQQEHKRQGDTISLIASENYAPPEILEACASDLMNKYAEGLPGKRYYAGCEIVDKVESLAIERCKSLFGVEHANVQPHSGSQANQAVYLGLLKPGDTILGMSLSSGGHLTHGHKVNFSGMFYQPISYTVDRETELLDYEAIAQLAHDHKPKLIIAGASAYSRAIDFARFAEIARSANALLLVDMAHIAGLVAAKLHPDPAPYADVITSTTHKTLRGPRGGFITSKAAYAAALDKAVMPGIQGGPFMNVIAAKALCFELASKREFLAYQKQVIANAQALAHSLAQLGWRIVSGGTDNHLFIVDLEQKLTGKQAELALEKAGITVSRSTIPFDPQPPALGSGIRLGTPAVTTRGMKEAEMEMIAQWVDEVLRNSDDGQKLKTVETEVKRFTKNHLI
jgi:glycine hydroxymethyltransferase